MKPDWGVVHERLHQSQQAFEGALTPDPQRVEAVFRERAARLAKPLVSDVCAPAAEPMFVFRLGTERYAIALRDLAEVISGPNCTPVPGSAPRLLGVINRKGEIQPVWDLASLLNTAGTTGDQPGFVLLMRRDGREIGIRIDAAEQVRVLHPEAWQRPGEYSRYIHGITADGVMVLKTEALLEEEFCR